MTDIDKWLENAVQPSCSGFEKENLPPDSRLWQLYSNPHIVCPMLSSLQISGWLSSVKTVALKRENIHLSLSLRVFLKTAGRFRENSCFFGKKNPAGAGPLAGKVSKGHTICVAFAFIWQKTKQL